MDVRERAFLEKAEKVLFDIVSDRPVVSDETKHLIKSSLLHLAQDELRKGNICRLPVLKVSEDCTAVDIDFRPPTEHKPLSIDSFKEREKARKKEQYNDLVSICQKSYGLKKGLFLANRIAKAFREVDDPCMDNFRLADSSNPSSMISYEDARRHGCCGFYDDNCTFVDKETGEKTTFYFGFNYGH